MSSNGHPQTIFLVDILKGCAQNVATLKNSIAYNCFVSYQKYEFVEIIIISITYVLFEWKIFLRSESRAYTNFMELLEGICPAKKNK